MRCWCHPRRGAIPGAAQAGELLGSSGERTSAGIQLRGLGEGEQDEAPGAWSRVSQESTYSWVECSEAKFKTQKTAEAGRSLCYLGMGVGEMGSVHSGRGVFFWGG